MTQLYDQIKAVIDETAKDTIDDVYVRLTELEAHIATLPPSSEKRAVRISARRLHNYLNGRAVELLGIGVQDGQIQALSGGTDKPDPNDPDGDD